MSPEAPRVTVSVENRELQLSNLDKPLFPTGFTKGDMLDYYAADRAGHARASRSPARDGEEVPPRRRATRGSSRRTSPSMRRIGSRP